ncbi:MAG: sulfatase-like hydrolase/transferase [Ardenticatenales bacterium]|nr:sulfatase-like hydrolase/transferase [Ardenticatenales bacterium]
MQRQIIFLMTDTQRTDMLGCYGNPDMQTPSLDELAAQGIRFDRAYTCQPVCGPARAALFTGLWPHSAGSWGNCIPLGDNVKTIGQRLRDNGIHTAYIGKWHLDGSDYFGLGRCPDGWDPDYWYDMRNYLEELSPEDRVRSRSPEINRDPNLTEDFTFAHRCSNRAIDFLSRHAEDDFFLAVSFDEPHGPCVCPMPYSEMYQGYKFPKSRNIWDTLEGKPEHQRVWAGESRSEDKDALEITPAEFLGCNSFVDSEIGRVIAAIDEYAPNALVIYTSDHGDMLASHSINNKGPAMYDEIARIPFIVRWPGRSPEGAACSHPVSHIDLVPTVMDAMGLAVPKSLEGQSMLETILDPAKKTNDAIFMEFGRYGVYHDAFGGFQPIRACFDGRFKLVINLLVTDELYDLEKDPEEMINLIDSEAHAAIRDRLHDRILDWMNHTLDPFRGYYWERRPWRLDAREATWEYTGMTRQRENEEYEPRQLDYRTGQAMVAAVRNRIPDDNS